MVAAGRNCNTDTHLPISYPGNQGVEMINFRFVIKPNALTFAPRFPQERLTQILNIRLIRLEKGRKVEPPFKLPRLKNRRESASNGGEIE